MDFVPNNDAKMLPLKLSLGEESANHKLQETKGTIMQAT